ncbi:MAG: hypothetical protein R8K49_03980, partial [Mariprofundaceae bacterium]
MRKDMLIFKIESIIDHKALQRLSSLNNAEASTSAKKQADALSPALHQVVAISYAHLRLEPGEQEPEIMLRRIGSGGDSNSSECELLEAFF